MALVQANASIDMSKYAFLKVLGRVIPGSGSLEETSFTSGNGVLSEVGPTIQWFGEGFAFSDKGGALRPISGEVDAIILADVTISNVSIAIEDIVEAAASGKYKALMQQVFSGDDVFSGTDGSSAYPKDIRGVERYFGCKGDDQFNGSLGADFFDGGKGFDEANYTNSASGLILDLTDPERSTGYAEGDSFRNVEVFVGSLGADEIVGAVSGRATLDGYLGEDTLVGGDGQDNFCFSTEVSKPNVDRIENFDAALDRITLRSHVFTEVEETGGRIAKGEFRFGATARDEDDRVLFDRETGRLFYDADGAGGQKARLFAIFEPGADLTARDVYVV